MGRMIEVRELGINGLLQVRFHSMTAEANQNTCDATGHKRTQCYESYRIKQSSGTRKCSDAPYSEYCYEGRYPTMHTDASGTEAPLMRSSTDSTSTCIYRSSNIRRYSRTITKN